MKHEFHYVPLESVLGEGQEYVSRIAAARGFDARAAVHRCATDTCHEKAALLGWSADRIIKAVYLHKDGEMYGFIFGEAHDTTRHISPKVQLPSLFGISTSQAKKFRNGISPAGMEYGTCTPFVYEDSFTQEEMPLKQLFIHRDPTLDEKLVDISIGGSGETAHTTSVHLPYGAIHTILVEHFGGDRILQTELFERRPLSV